MTPQELDAVWQPLMQASEHARQQLSFYNRMLDEGRRVSLDSLDRAEQTLQAAVDNEKPLREEWEIRRGWSRAWVDAQGLAHCCPDCEHSVGASHLLPSLSGVREHQVVDMTDANVCTECFPAAKQHPVWMARRRRQQMQESCPGSNRKPDADGCCSVCGEAAQFTAKGRVKSHPRSVAAVSA